MRRENETKLSRRVHTSFGVTAGRMISLWSFSHSCCRGGAWKWATKKKRRLALNSHKKSLSMTIFAPPHWHTTLLPLLLSLNSSSPASTERVNVNFLSERLNSNRADRATSSIFTIVYTALSGGIWFSSHLPNYIFFSPRPRRPDATFGMAIKVSINLFSIYSITRESENETCFRGRLAVET